MEITPEIQQAIDSAIEAATKGLKTKNAELLSANKNLKTEKSEAEEAADTAAQLAAEKANDIEALKTSLQKHYKKQIDDLTASRDAANQHLEKLVIDNGIKDAMTANGVAAPFQKAVAAMIKADAKIVDGIGMIGDQTIDAYTKAFTLGDEGKHFVSAPANTGAGATGSSVTRNVWNKAPDRHDTAAMSEWDRYGITNPTEATALADSWGRPDLRMI